MVKPGVRHRDVKNGETGPCPEEAGEGAAPAGTEMGARGPRRVA